MLTGNNRRLKTVFDELEAGLGCGAQFRVLLHLALHPDEAFTAYGLVRATGLRTPDVNEQLRRLVELGWAERHGSSPAMYRLRLENEVVQLIRGFLLELKRPEPSNQKQPRQW
ncbi:MAG: MarR family transcriptional regulator [Candidatus Bathyarchaeia archaeon]